VAVPAYLVLGIEHLLFGLDHILFVIGLMFLVRSFWPLVKTITAFTAAHSVTLAASTLGLVRLQQEPVEVVIALSILFLAVELARGADPATSIAVRKPWIVAFAFGLLHGFGFAGALADIGLPRDAAALALLLFNLGVELGQLAIVGIVLTVLWLLRRTGTVWPAWIVRLPIVGMGTISSYWAISRLVAMGHGGV
jgi:hydrogenase/urease accessory protein HupE